MSLPKSNVSFVIPSIHDDLELDCRIHYPRKTEQNGRLFGRGFAIFAHPYAPLGGCYDDPVVGLTGSVLLQSGWLLVTFNFRGAAGSAGRTSWSGKPELGDYLSVYGFTLCYVDAICRLGADDTDVSARDRPLLILGGYSYGSMIASHLPSCEVVADLFRSPTPGSAESEIKIRAEDLSRDARAYFEMHLIGPSSDARRLAGEDIRNSSGSVVLGGYESDAARRRVSRESSRRSIDGERVKQGIDRLRRKISTHVQSLPAPEERRAPTVVTPTLPTVAYVLVSPLLSTVAGFTTMFSKLRFTRKGGDATSPSKEEFDELVSHPCCCLYGKDDVFTSDQKLRRWTEDLGSRPGSQFVTIRADTGHFWHEPEGVMQLRRGLAEWLKTLAPKEQLP